MPLKACKPGLLRVWMLLLTATLTTASLLALTWHRAQHDEAELMPFSRVHMPSLTPRSTLDAGMQTTTSNIFSALVYKQCRGLACLPCCV